MILSDTTGAQISPLGSRAPSSWAIASLPALYKHAMVEDIVFCCTVAFHYHSSAVICPRSDIYLCD